MQYENVMDWQLGHLSRPIFWFFFEKKPLKKALKIS
jgi:hypothetical protein